MSKFLLLCADASLVGPHLLELHGGPLTFALPVKQFLSAHHHAQTQLTALSQAGA